MKVVHVVGVANRPRILSKQQKRLNPCNHEMVFDQMTWLWIGLAPYESTMKNKCPTHQRRQKIEDNDNQCPCGWLKAILAQCKVGTAAAGIVIIGPKRFYAKS